MLVYDIIRKKRDGETLTKEEIEFVVMGFVNGEIPDYQVAAFLMAIFFRGMTPQEITDLTMVMVDSGDRIDLSAIPGIKVDKHSTGGVGDTTTLVLAPLVAAAGVPVAKISGRGLGHTGGTLDKLESIPGLSTSLLMEDFIKQVREIGIAIIGQTQDLVPADKKFYALRDVTATIDSIPLIASSIMSKKIAAGSDAILLDVKVGSGAFMKDLESARGLGNAMVEIGKLAGRKVGAVISNMDQPLGSYIGNSLEVLEAIEILKGKHKDSPLYEVSMFLTAHLLVMGGVVESYEEGREKAEITLLSGKGAKKFKEMISAQGGDPEVVEDTARLPWAPVVRGVNSTDQGYITKMEAETIGKTAALLGAGRKTKEDKIDPAVGLIIRKRVGDMVYKGEELVQVHANSEEDARRAEEMYISALTISDEKPEKKDVILDFISY
ncbi:MAG: pyrimidine-nucleoside phosphorylase [Candidatus Eremiobacteraeota bacterium]|nr:pyrimidine-nucleoside phosphorylase [Candidatus Eremiobacteraeota bacterium]